MAYIELLLLDVCIACLSSILGHAFFVGCCKKKKPAPRPVASIRPMSLLPGGLPVLQPSSAPAASNTPEPSAGKNEPPKTSTADIKKEDESKQSAKSPENKKKAPEEKTAPDDQDPGALSLDKTQKTVSQRDAHDDGTMKNIESINDDKHKSDG